MTRGCSAQPWSAPAEKIGAAGKPAVRHSSAKGVKPEAEFVTATDYKDDNDYEDDRGSAECRVRSAEWRTFNGFCACSPA